MLQHLTLFFFLVGTTSQNPSFQQYNTDGNNCRIDISFLRDRWIHKRIEEGRNSHLSSGIAIVTIPCEEHGRNILSHLEEGILVVILVLLISNWSLNHDIPATILPFSLEELHALFVVIAFLKILIPSCTFEGTKGTVCFPLDDINRELVAGTKQVARLDRGR